MKLYLRKKNILNNYLWRPFFCWYPVLAKDFFGKGDVLIWLEYVWRQGPFKANGKKSRGRYHYKLDPPYPDLYRFHITGGTKEYEIIADSLIDKHFSFLEKIENEQQKLYPQQIENMIKSKSLNKKVPAPIEEGSGMKKLK